MKKKVMPDYGGKEKYPSKTAKVKPGAKKMPPAKMKKC